MIGKTFVMFGYANKEFEFEFVLFRSTTVPYDTNQDAGGVVVAGLE